MQESESYLETGVTGTGSPYFIKMAYGKREITIKYDQCILSNPDSYVGFLENIKSEIDWCIRKSFENKETKDLCGKSFVGRKD